MRQQYHIETCPNSFVPLIGTVAKPLQTVLVPKVVGSLVKCHPRTTLVVCIMTTDWRTERWRRLFSQAVVCSTCSRELEDRNQHFQDQVKDLESVLEQNQKELQEWEDSSAALEGQIREARNNLRNKEEEGGFCWKRNHSCVGSIKIYFDIRMLLQCLPVETKYYGSWFRASKHNFFWIFSFWLSQNKEITYFSMFR